MDGGRRRRPVRNPEWERWPISEALRRQMVRVAQSFRKEPTRGEAILWAAIRGRQLDAVKFRRQQPIGSFVVDFYATEHRLVVEVDGAIHETSETTTSTARHSSSRWGSGWSASVRSSSSITFLTHLSHYAPRSRSTLHVVPPR